MGTKVRACGLVALLSGLGWLGPVQALDWSSTLALESAYSYESGDWQKNSVTWRPQIVGRLGYGTKVTAEGLVRVDVEDNLDPGQPSQPFRARDSRAYFPNDLTDLELRELYLDHYLGSAFIRIGRQQIVWGQADGLRVLDVINPLTYREFIMPDLEERRVPLWSAQAEIPVSGWTVQLVWVPDGSVTESMLPGATYALFEDPFDGQGEFRVNRPESGRQGDGGLRASAFAGGWDLTLNYLFHTVDDPLVQVDPVAMVTTFNYNRSHLFGATAARAFGSLTLRGEIGSESQRRYAQAGYQGWQSTRETSYVVGLDYSVSGDLLLSAQLFQRWRHQADADLERHREQLTFLARQELMNDALIMELLTIYDVQDQEALSQLSANYRVSSRWELSAGGDVFSGDRSGTFGRFHDSSRIYIGAMLSW
ncbi:DUF1302 family protein [Marinobacter zhejiangensis]|uniref:Porin n=1 Tax=Marinobacter zhejiangensis TaxID=488535 RepID=A0A1I4LBT5_9GAMM|nr:DUF1302 family protein [Marinobacter zhejiangensis]SFL88515.1 hypothetical protein SAMN04487963_0399 [Marinobacter zhejiangensis]